MCLGFSQTDNSCTGSKHKSGLLSIGRNKIISRRRLRPQELELNYEKGVKLEKNDVHAIDYNGSVVVPSKFLLLLNNQLEEENKASMIIGDNHIQIKFEMGTITSRIIKDPYPNYDEVIPKDNNHILKINRQDFSMAVDRVSTITSDKSPIIKFKLLNNVMNMSSVNSDSGTATEDIITKYSGIEIEIGFNSKYILEMINNLEDDEITLSFKDSSSPVIATEKSNPNLIYVLMPMRV